MYTKASIYAIVLTTLHAYTSHLFAVEIIIAVVSGPGTNVLEDDDNFPDIKFSFNLMMKQYVP